MISLRSIELGDTLDNHVIALSSTARENNIFALSTDQGCDLLWDGQPENQIISAHKTASCLDDEVRTLRASSTAASASHP